MPPHRVYIEAFLGGGSVLRHKRPAERSIGVDRDHQVIDRWQMCPGKHVELLCADAMEFLAGFPYRGDELVYADPPYLPSTRRARRYYRYELTTADHSSLLELLKRLPCSVVLSGYPSDLYDRALESWTTTTIVGTSHVGRRLERLWMNFAPGSALHDYQFVGTTFRDRERLRRKLARWKTSLERLPPVHRRIMLDELNSAFAESISSPHAGSTAPGSAAPKHPSAPNLTRDRS